MVSRFFCAIVRMWSHLSFSFFRVPCASFANLRRPKRRLKQQRSLFGWLHSESFECGMETVGRVSQENLKLRNEVKKDDSKSKEKKKKEKNGKKEKESRKEKERGKKKKDSKNDKGHLKT